MFQQDEKIEYLKDGNWFPGLFGEQCEDGTVIVIPDDDSHGDSVNVPLTDVRKRQ